MELLGIVLAMLDFLLSVVTFLKLEIVFLPWILCELFGASNTVTGVVVSVAAVAWVVRIIRSVTDVFKK